MRKTVASLIAIALFSFCQQALAINAQNLRELIQKEEGRIHARIGVSVIDTGNNQVFSYRSDERFPLNSTHKVLSCAAMLYDIQRGSAHLDNNVVINKGDLIDYSPVTQHHLFPKKMTLRELCAASISYSDNTAANKVLEYIGGPAGVTRFTRLAGDNITRLDREEPALNASVPGDLRDTTTPAAVTATLRRIFESDLLHPSYRSQLNQWMMNDKVASELLRSSLPNGWSIADKTGAGGYGSRSIVAAVYPQNQKPLYVAIYITQTQTPLHESNQVIAHIGKAIFD